MEIIKKDGSSIELVRFFEYQGKKILIFNNGEGVDANGHVTIHICNVDMNNGAVASAIQEPDMDMVRNVIKTIVSENRSGALSSIKDLNYNDLNGIMIVSDWPLKMMPNYIDIIKMNQPTFDLATVQTSEQENFNSFENQVFNEPPMVNNINTEQTVISNENINQGMSENMTNFNPFQNFQNPQPIFNNEPIATQSVNNDNITLQNDAQMDEQNVSNNDMQTDYEKLYFEQLSVTNRLNAEVEMYKSKLEQLKNIIEN